MCESRVVESRPFSTDYSMRALSITNQFKGNKQKKPVCGLVLCGWKVGRQM
jgi:hypothetical protein